MVIINNPALANIFHELMRDGGYKSRIRIYSIDLSQNPIDVSNQTEVEEYGALLKYNNSDTDSNGRIGQRGITINNYYNKDEQYTIGNAPICNIKISLINDDGFFGTYDWEQTVIIYWDAWDPYNNEWITCPLGIYLWERPTKVNAVVIEAKASDYMYELDQRADYSFPSDFGNGKTLGELYTHLVSNIAGIIPYAHPEEWPNMDAFYFSAPFDTTDMTRREILGKMAEIVGGNAYMSRDGYVKITPFKNASWKVAPSAQPTFYVLDGDSGPTPINTIEIGEYTVPVIDMVVAKVGQTGQTYTSGSGTNVLYSINNGFLNTFQGVAQEMVDTLLEVVAGENESSDMVAYTPISLEAYADPTVEGGDVIRVIRGGTTYLMPVFQQTLYWNGADWTVEMQNSGTEKRTIPSEASRKSFVTENRISTLERDSGGTTLTATIDATGVLTVQIPTYDGSVS